MVMDYLEEAKNNMAQVMTDYRYKIEELEREEYFAVDKIAEEALKQIPLYQELTHNGEYCKFIEVVPSKQVFRIFKGDRVLELKYDEVLNLSIW
jgi:hypothetical protein